MSLPSLPERVAGVRNRIREACRRAGRSPEAVRLVAVSKTRPAEEIDAVAACGVEDFGENRVQEALAKLPRVTARITPHLIGHLQKNKARAAARSFPWVHSVDSEALARRLSRIVGEGATPPGGGPLRVLLQVDLAREATKFGVSEVEAAPVLEVVRGLPGLDLKGLMLIPPFDPDPEAARPWFVRLRELSERCAAAGLLPPEPELSMGMSHDFEVAIAEGATTIRVGTAIFGPRTPPGGGRPTRP